MPPKRTNPPKRAPLQEIVPNTSRKRPAPEDDHNDSESLSFEETPQDDRENFSIHSQKANCKDSEKLRKAEAEAAAVEIRHQWECKVEQPPDFRTRRTGAPCGDSIQRCARIWILQQTTTSEFYEFPSLSKRYLVDTQIRTLDTVELENGAFIRVLEQIRGQMLVGHLFERNTKLMDWLPRTDDEVFWLWTFPSGDPKKAEPAIVKAPKSAVRRVWKLCLAPPRNTRYSVPRDSQPSLEAAQLPHSERGILTCSWKYVRAAGAMIDRAEYQPDFPSRFEETSLIAVPGMDDDEDGSRHARKAVGRYTFGDAFAGCGGMSRAALTAGFDIQWGFDMCPAAVKAYKMNFPSTKIWAQWATEFINRRKDPNLKVDVLHISPPCQFFSRVHTTEGKDDALNKASLFTFPAILEKTDPRVVTVEQVDNIMAPKHFSFFCNLIQFFTRSGYSTRWKAMKCVDYGVPQQNRWRLFMIGSR